MTITRPELDAMIRRLIKREGGSVDHPADVGGCTKYGITLPTLQRHRGRGVSCADVRMLSEAEAITIYRSLWVEHPQMQLAEWPYRRAAEVTLDASIMFGDGPALAVGWMQQAINAQGKGPLKVDGHAGPATRAAMVMCDEERLVAYVVAMRIKRHAARVAKAPSQLVFLEGWVNRATGWLVREDKGMVA